MQSSSFRRTIFTHYSINTMLASGDKLNVLLVDDHDLFRDGLKLVLGQIKKEVSLHEASSLADLRAMSAEQRSAIDVVLLDYRLPDSRGFEGLSLAKQLFGPAKIIVISGETDPQTIQQLVAQGACGFIPKASSAQVVAAALQLVLAGGVYLPVSLLSRNRTALAGQDRNEDAMLRLLSARQYEVLMLALHGKTNKAIGRELGISNHTVKAHLSIAFRALGVSNRCEAVYAATQFGLGPSQDAP